MTSGTVVGFDYEMRVSLLRRFKKRRFLPFRFVLRARVRFTTEYDTTMVSPVELIRPGPLPDRGKVIPNWEEE